MLARLKAHVQLARPAQWIKNIFVVASLPFSDKRHDPASFISIALAFLAFSLLSGAVYAFNDLRDHKEDALHPTKRTRPVASGRLSPLAAGFESLLLAIAGLALAWWLSPGFGTTSIVYLLLNLGYSLGLKHVALLDVIIVAIGFVLRALGGAQVLNVEVSAWLVICTFTLCLFLGFGKRRCELVMLESPDKASSHRRALARYTPDLLNQLLSVTGGIAVITFLLYTLDSHTARSFRPLIFTTPLVFYAVFRYAMVIERGEHPGPSDILINDRPFLFTAVVWMILTASIVYHGKRIEPYLPKLRWPGAETIDAAPWGTSPPPATRREPAPTTAAPH